MTEINAGNGEGVTIEPPKKRANGGRVLSAGVPAPDEGGHGVFRPYRGHSYFGALLR